jgi:hypothetical protein
MQFLLDWFYFAKFKACGVGPIALDTKEKLGVSFFEESKS